MPATRRVTGKLYRSNGRPKAFATIYFTPTDDVYTIVPPESILKDRVSATSDANGNFAISLVSGLSAYYTVTMPDKEQFNVWVPNGGDVTLEVLRANYEVTPTPVETVEEIITDLVQPTVTSAVAAEVADLESQIDAVAADVAAILQFPAVIVFAGDDEATIATKLAAAGGGLAIFEGDTIYTITNGELNPPNNTKIDGNGATLKLANNVDDHRQMWRIDGKTNIEISGFTFDGNIAGQSVWSEFIHIVVASGSSHVHIHNNRFINLVGDGILFRAGYSGGAPCFMSSAYENDFVGTEDNRNGISVTHGHYIAIHHNYLHNMGGPTGMPGALDLEPNASQYVRHIIVSENFILNDGSPGARNAISFNTVNTALACHDIQIVHNTCEGGFTERVINARGSAGQTHNILIAENTINGAGVVLPPIGINIGTIVGSVSNNEINNINGDGIAYNAAEALQILSNTIRNCVDWGIEETGTASTNVAIRDNEFFDCGATADATSGCMSIRSSLTEIVSNRGVGNGNTPIGLRIPSSSGTKMRIDLNRFEGISTSSLDINTSPQYFGPGNVLTQGAEGSITAGSFPPTTGTHARGVQIHNPLPSAGGFIGVVCTTGGSPGTWKSFGAIAA